MRKYAFFSIQIIGLLLLCYTSYAQHKTEQWDRFEIALKYAHDGNPFIDVQLSAIFTQGDTSIVVPGFYDGQDNFFIRFMPFKTGIWNYRTTSNKAGLDDKKGSFECIKATANNHGIVKVTDTYNFSYADGKQFYPFGTTAYAWIHMGKELQQMTLNTLKNSGFNKVRMCIFSKNYDLVKTEPQLYPFQIKDIRKDDSGNEIKVWDFTRFNPAFFRHLESRVDDLDKIGIEADLILFHPYDKGRWGFDSMPMEVNIRYIKYVTARLSSFRNVWWSLANEWDYIKSRTHDDWDKLSKTVVENDPYGHLCSIHGSTASYFEYWKSWFTHVSIQDEAPVKHFGAAAILRNALHKPVIYDEVGYEGNLDRRWGRYSPQEMTHLVWMGVIAGTYVTHGETYQTTMGIDTIFWADGGKLKGTSWKRIAFLRQLMEEGPGPLQMADVSRDDYTATAGDGYYIIYFGNEMHDSWMFNLPHKNAEFKRPEAGDRYKVEIVDSWEMTIHEYPQIFEATKVIDYRVYDKNFGKVRLPLTPYIALRVIKMK